MKVYVPIGYYNDPEDIIDLYPNFVFKGDEADIISKYMEDGYGAFHTIDHPDADSYITKKEALEDNNILFSSDGKYIVRFSEGNYHLLHNHEDNHGFFIDIYLLEEVDDYEETQPVEDVRKLQATYDKLIIVREKIDRILMELAPYVSK